MADMGQTDRIKITGNDALSDSVQKAVESLKRLEAATAIAAIALHLGKDTSFSAKEAAAGLEELVKAGASLKATRTTPKRRRRRRVQP